MVTQTRVSGGRSFTDTADDVGTAVPFEPSDLQKAERPLLCSAEVIWIGFVSSVHSTAASAPPLERRGEEREARQGENSEADKSVLGGAERLFSFSSHS